jgi:hypothetical protein
MLCIENLPPYKHGGPVIQLYNNFYDDALELCVALRNELNTDRIGLVLDTCHQGITQIYMDLIYGLNPKLKKPDFSIEHYIKAYAPYLKIIHLADFKGVGYSKDYGIPFREQEKLDKILDLVHKHVAEDCYLTLEVIEDNYLACNNYTKAKKMIDLYYKRKTI